jgi:uncharacterized protein YecE (DUF72 family)
MSGADGSAEGLAEVAAAAGRGLLYGTSSWSEAAWDGVFYPKGTKAADRLAWYATRFPTVEADVTYYRVPSRAMVAAWRDRTPERFVVSAKFPRSIVHGGDGATPDPARLLLPEAVGAETARFLEAMGELGGKCGPLVLQFPYFNRRAFAGPQPFLERLERYLSGLPREFRYGVEVRNRTWLAAPLLELLRAHGVALVLADLPYLPHPEEWSVDPWTADFGYVRLIGDRRATEATGEAFDHVQLDRRPQLVRWSRTIRRLLGQVPTAFVYANNHFAGYAPATVAELAGLVAGSAE